jgi:hypothetical protein
LDAVHAGIPADHGMVVFSALAVVAQDAETLGEIRVAGDHRTGLTEGAEVFAGVKAKAGGMAEGSDALALVFGAMGLTGILDDGELVIPGETQDGIHIGGLAEEVDRDNGFGAGSEGGGEEGGIEIAGRFIDIDEGGGGTGEGDGFGGGHEGGGSGDDLISGSDAEGQEGEPEGIGSIADGDGMGGLAEGGEGFLEAGDERAAGEGAGIQDLGHGGIEFGAQGYMLCLQIEEGDIHQGKSG